MLHWTGRCIRVGEPGKWHVSRQNEYIVFMHVNPVKVARTMALGDLPVKANGQ
jgi:hypothetical protein